MYEKQTVVVNTSGLHARPAAIFVSKAKQFQSNITITNLQNGKSADAKSVLRLMMLVLVKGTPVSISAEGEDEQEAVDELTAFMDAGAGE
jgi:phosphocarrier protein